MNAETTPSAYVNSPEKRVVDVAACILLAPVVVPTVGLLAVAVKIEDGGDVFFKQDRVGKGGKLFTMYKVRTFGEGKETNIGKLIRPLGLDELPQIWNILRGEMSLFGIRAVPPDEFEEYCNESLTAPEIISPELAGAWKEAYTAGRPGGLSFAIARGTSVFHRRFKDPHQAKQKMELDIEHIENETFGMDMAIVGEIICKALDQPINPGMTA